MKRQKRTIRKARDIWCKHIGPALRAGKEVSLDIQWNQRRNIFYPEEFQIFIHSLRHTHVIDAEITPTRAVLDTLSEMTPFNNNEENPWPEGTDIEGCPFMPFCRAEKFKPACPYVLERLLLEDTA